MTQYAVLYQLDKRSSGMQPLSSVFKKGVSTMTAFRSFGASIGYLAALIQAIAFLWYFWEIFLKDAHTNPISWWLWLGETLIGLLIYADRTRDMSKWITEAVALVGVVIVAAYLTGRVFLGDAAAILAPVEPVDIFAALAAMIAFWFWLATRKKQGPSAALWLFQIALIAAAFPLIRATFADPSGEPLWPWLLWTLSFCLQFLCATIRWDGVEALLNPANYAITHGLVALIILLSAVP